MHGRIAARFIEEHPLGSAIPRVAGQHLVGQRQAFGRDDQRNHHLRAVRPLVTAVAVTALIALRHVSGVISKYVLVRSYKMLMKLGAARSRAPGAWRLVDIEMDKESSMFIYGLNRQKLRSVRRREGRYLLCTNLTENDPALLWQYYSA